ncbi:hypothetical protein AVEN_48579-1 [Araneus ventricosus]|uniref:Uncharacterized protein n=1 Tax=Araneus ventricosus TaxID=182803 RepID=A0A4Y2HF28_ARAVE|nr:hypothetical protein AVEN_48579-1 [Araneus ventricosus]
METESLEVAGEGPMASGELDAFSEPVQLFVRYFRYNAVNRSASLTIIPLSLPTRDGNYSTYEIADRGAVSQNGAFQSAGTNDLLLLCWPAKFPDLTPCDFFLWGFVKDKRFVPLLPQGLQELKQRITNVFNALTGDLLSPVWQELDYRVDICRVTGGAHIEHL